MAKHLPKEWSVYLAFKDVFIDGDAKLRVSKRIEELIVANQATPLVADLIQKHGIEEVCVAVKALLRQGFFEDVQKARKRFPETFQASARQSANEVTTRAKIAEAKAIALGDATGGQKCIQLEGGADEVVDRKPRSSKDGMFS